MPSHLQPGSTDRSEADRGFTLLEVLIAMVLVSTLAAGLAELFVVAARATSAARHQMSATIAASQKLEQLRALTWTFSRDGSGASTSDLTTDLSRDPPTSGAAGLRPSPADSLDVNTDGYVDFLDAAGRWVGTGPVPPPAAIYVRRWSIEPLPADPDHTLILQVFATTVAADHQRSGAGAGHRVLSEDDAIVTGVKTRTG